MKTRRFSDVRAVLLLTTATALAATAAYTQQVLADEDQEDGRIVEISPDSGGRRAARDLDAQDDADAEPVYWLGIQGQPLDSPVLRTHLQLADDVGIVVEDVVKDSPAEKAGLRRHDVLIDVNGEQISDMLVLQQAVAASAGKPINLKLIRLAAEKTIEIAPELRPEGLAQSAPLGEFDGMPMGEFQEMLKQLQGGGLGGGVRVFGPGMIMNGQRFDMQRLPGGVEVNITRENDQPAKITVRKGDQTWTIEGDDQEALKKLPDDVRPFVEQMLGGQRPGQGLVPNFPGAEGFRMALPDNLGNFNIDIDGEQFKELGREAEKASEQMLKRLEELERQLEQLQDQLDGQKNDQDDNAAADPTKA